MKSMEIIRLAAFALTLAGSARALADNAPPELRGRFEVEAGEVISLAFSPDGKAIACGCAKELLDPFGAVELWDATSLHRLAALRDHAGGVNALAFTPDGTTVATASNDTSVCLRELASDKARFTMKGGLVPAPVHAVAISADGKLVASGDWLLRLWDAATGTERAAFVWTDGVQRDQITAVAFSPDGQWLASASWEGTVKLWDVSKAAATNVTEDALARLRKQKEWNPDVARLKRTFKGPVAQVWTIAFSPDSSALAVGYADGTIKTWDVAKGEPKQAMQNGAAVRVLRFTPAGDVIIAANADGAVKVWDAKSGNQITTWKAAETGLSAMTLAPDGRMLVTASGGVVKAWTGAWLRKE
jgi:WD40 repeat protein